MPMTSSGTRYSWRDITSGGERRTTLRLGSRARCSLLAVLLTLLTTRDMLGSAAMEALAGVGARHHAHDDADPCGSHDHAMVFHSCVCAEILFKGWNTTNELELFGSAVVIFVASVLYEGFKYWRETLHRPAAAAAALSDSRQDIAKSEPSRRAWSGAHAQQTALHALQAALSYLLMLVFMTYNVWLCLAVLLGLTLGYFLFGWRRAAVDTADHCQ